LHLIFQKLFYKYINLSRLPEDYTSLKSHFQQNTDIDFFSSSSAESKPLKRLRSIERKIINTAINRGVNHITKIVLNCFNSLPLS